MEISDSISSWVERCNITFSETPILTASDFVKLFSNKVKDTNWQNSSKDVSERTEVDVPDISILLENKQALLNAIANVQSALSILNPREIQNGEQVRFLRKLYLLLSLLLHNKNISKAVYIDLFSTFLESCGIVSWPTETIQRTAVILGKELRSSPDLCLLTREINDTSMSTLGTVTYSDEKFDTQRNMLHTERTPLYLNKENEPGTSNIQNLLFGNSHKSSKTVKFQNKSNDISQWQKSSTADIIYSTKPKQNENGSSSSRTLLLKDLINQSSSQHSATASTFLSQRKRTIEGHVRQPAVKLPLPNGAINKVPIIITLAADDEEPDTQHHQHPVPEVKRFGQTQGLFEPPGRKLSLPSRLFSGIRSAIEHEFPSTRLLIEHQDSRKQIIPVVVTTADSSEESIEDSPNGEEETDVDENVPGISREKKRRIESGCSNNSKFESNESLDGDAVDSPEGVPGISKKKKSRIESGCSNNSNCESNKSFGDSLDCPESALKDYLDHESSNCNCDSNEILQSLTPMPPSSCDSILNDIENLNTFNYHSQKDLDTKEKENMQNSVGQDRNTSSKVFNCFGKYSVKTEQFEKAKNKTKLLGGGLPSQTFCGKTDLVKKPLDADIDCSNDLDVYKRDQNPDSVCKLQNIQNNQRPGIPESDKTCAENERLFETPRNTIRARVYYRRNPNLPKQPKMKNNIAQKSPKNRPQKCQKEREKKENGIDFPTKNECNALTFKGNMAQSSNSCPQNFIIEDKHWGQPNYATPSVFTISPENSMYSFKINSEFETNSAESQNSEILQTELVEFSKSDSPELECVKSFEPGLLETLNPGTSKIEFEVQEIHDTTKRQFINLASIDWLLDQPLNMPETMNFPSNPLESMEISVPCSEISYTPNLAPTNVNTNAFSENEDELKNKSVDVPPNTRVLKLSDFVSNLLVGWPHSLLKPISVGFLLHKTKVIVAVLEISQAHFDCLSENKVVLPDNAAVIRYTKELDLLKKFDRAELAYIASNLSEAVNEQK